MKARIIIKDDAETIKLLCADGTIMNMDTESLRSVMLSFKHSQDFSGADGMWSEFCRDMAVYPGCTLAYVADDLSLVIVDPLIFSQTYSTCANESYIGLVDYARKVNKSEQIIKVLCREGRMPGAKKIGGRWMIPEHIPYPIAPSRQHGKSLK